MSDSEHAHNNSMKPRPVTEAMKPLQIALFLLALVSQAQAESLVLPGGIAVDPAPPLDLTYQVVPSYDPNEKVIAGWAGDKLLYFITAEKLPPGWIHADKYFQGLISDLRASGRSVEVARSGKYQGVSTLSGKFVEIRHGSASQTVHFLTDGKIAFFAIANLVDKSANDRMLEESTLLFKSAYLTTDKTTEPIGAKSESAFIGSWRSSGVDSNGNPADVSMILKEDLTFSAAVKSEGMDVFVATGVWSVSGRRLFWTYMHSQPLLPSDKKEDEDEIVSLDRDRLVLRSRLSGREREFFRQ